MGSSRFPGKPLEPLLGLPLVLHVFERCRLCPDLERVVIATCDEEIRVAARNHGAEVVMTADSHPGCVDRTDETVALIGGYLSDDDLVLMVQGDEIMVSPAMLSAIARTFSASDVPVVNLVSRIYKTEDHDDPNCVKAVGDPNGGALYFSRSAIPSRYRLEPGQPIPTYQQTGIIGFSKAFIHRFGQLPRTPLEEIECIDMMRVIEHGLPVQLVHSEQETIGVDTPADAARAEAMLLADPVTATYMDMPE